MRIHEVMDKPFELEGHEIYTSASIGIVVSDGLHYEYATELLRDADTAMFRAKQRGSGQTEVFDETMHDRAVVLLRTETELRHAIEREEICVYYQPIYNVAEQTLAGFEALARWQHPQRGLVPPDQFIPVAEETGLITDIGRQVLLQACQQLQQWNTGHPEQTPLFVSVNLSAKQFLHHNLVQEVDTILSESGLDASRLRLEITESVLLENPDETLEILHALRSRGIQLYIDDFGTGYSSLSYLHSFPFDALKIDRSFVSKLELDERHHGIVQAIVAIARHLGMNTIAEGIETESQLEWIRQLGCGHAQGFLFSPPLPAGQASSLIQSGTGCLN
jgi:EAL domain-containing protein (putative c-di-GMP-specific phosphodiesterase class I)